MKVWHFSVSRRLAGSLPVARRYLMTWHAPTRRWVKKFKGKMYFVSCRQLGTEETKEESAAAANAWWQAKQQEIEEAPPTEQDLRVNAFRVYSMVQDWEKLDEASREKLVDSLIGGGQYQKLKAQAEAVVASTSKAPLPDRTVKVQVEAWLTLLRGVCLSGQMSEGRLDGYTRNID